jgi:hypothetical protein
MLTYAGVCGRILTGYGLAAAQVLQVAAKVKEGGGGRGGEEDGRRGKRLEVRRELEEIGGGGHGSGGVYESVSSCHLQKLMYDGARSFGERDPWHTTTGVPVAYTSSLRPHALVA